jgi:SAM-dependent methyltransferase
VNLWDQRYATEHYVYGTEPNAFLAEVADILTPGSALCLAEGEGRNAVFLAGLGHQVLAVDASAVGLAKAERLARERGVNVETRLSDLVDFRIEPAAWDLVVSIFCHVPPVLRRDLHRRVVAGLKPGGRLILEAYTPRQLVLGTGGPPTAEMMMTLAELREELDGLEMSLADELERDVIEGSLHTGRGAVVRILAVKPGASKVGRGASRADADRR